MVLPSSSDEGMRHGCIDICFLIGLQSSSLFRCHIGQCCMLVLVQAVHDLIQWHPHAVHGAQ